MMESNFYSDEFEQLIRGKTEQYKMYPSEKVWKGIHGSLHTRRKWFIMGMSLLIMGILFFAGKELIAPSTHPSLAKKSPASSGTTANSKTSTDNTANSNIPTPVPVLHRFHAGDDEQAAADGRRMQTGTETAEDNDDQTYRGVTITVSHLVISQPDLSVFLSNTVKLPTETPALPVVDNRPAIAAVAGEDHTADEHTAAGGSAERTAETEGRAGFALHNSPTSKKSLASTRNAAGNIADHETLLDTAGKTAKNTINLSESIADQQKVNWLADYAVYNLPSSAKRGRTQLQFYFSPTISYRTLSGGNFTAKSSYQNIPLALYHVGEAKNYVDHNPALGFSMGSTMQYRLTRNLTIKGGLQFSFSRYTIRAYASNTPQQSTIALNSYYGYYLDSLTNYTNISNFAGKTQISLNNDYYQLAAPVGFELRIMGNERLQLNIGATIQPTYLLNTNSYVLSSDYTNYTKAPSIMRRWNVNGALEAFLSYKMRSGLRWQIGPEFRYQMMSTYDNEYSIHEHLKGYGLKFGIVKTLP